MASVRVLVIPLALALGCLAAPAARADSDVTLGNGDKVTGTLSPASEVERFRVFLPSNAKLTVTAKGKKPKKGTAPTVALLLTDPNGQDLQVPYVQTPTGAKLANHIVETGGVHVIAVRCTNGTAGDYTFSAKWVHPKQIAFSASLAMGAGSAAFTADPGTKTTFTVRPASGATFARLVRVEEDPEDSYEFAFPAPSDANALTHTAKKVTLGGAGAYRLFVSGGPGMPDGEVSGDLRFAPPKPKPRKVTLTGGGDGSFVKGAVIGAAGGIVSGNQDGDSPIEGSSVSIPAGALAKPQLIFVGTGGAVAAPTGTSAGIAVAFTPDGLTFAAGKSATVTIPFDPTVFPAPDFSGLRVFVKDKAGIVSLVPTSGYVIDGANGLVSFPAEHFSTYQAFGPTRRRPADLDGDGIDDLVVSAKDKVVIYWGAADFSATSPSHTITGNADSEFGSSLVVADATGDNISDLVVSASNEDTVYIFSGGTRSLPTTQAGANSSLASTAGTQRFGLELAVGDVTGDGVNDLLVSNPTRGGAQTLEGRVSVFRGPGDYSDKEEDTADIVISGGAFEAQLGHTLIVGDLVGDAAQDILIGGRGYMFNPGNVNIVTGGASLVSDSVLNIGTRYVGDANGDEFGESIAVGDVNGDGVNDLLVGAPGVDVVDGSTFIDAGTVFAFYGPTFAGGGPSSASQDLFAFPSANSRRGEAIGVGQLIGDSVRDLLIGAPFTTGQAAEGGGVFLLRGGPAFGSGYQGSTSGEAGSHRGSRIYSGLDLDGDGREESIYSEPDSQMDVGRVRVFFGPGLFQGRDVELVGAPGDHLGGD